MTASSNPSVDHDVSEAVYLRDPDQNGVELYVDKPTSQWPRNDDGTLQMVNEKLNVAAIIALADAPSQN